VIDLLVHLLIVGAELCLLGFAAFIVFLLAAIVVEGAVGLVNIYVAERARRVAAGRRPKVRDDDFDEVRDFEEDSEGDFEDDRGDEDDRDDDDFEGHDFEGDDDFEDDRGDEDDRDDDDFDRGDEDDRDDDDFEGDDDFEDDRGEDDNFEDDRAHRHRRRRAPSSGGRRRGCAPEFDAAEAVQAARRVLAEETSRLAVDAPATAWPTLDPPAIEAVRAGEREADAIVCGALRHRLFLSPKVRGFDTKPTRAGWEVHVCLAGAPCATVTAKRRDLALALALKHVYGFDA